MLTAHKSVLGLDVGNKRVGVAAASLAARLPRPVTTLERNDNFFKDLDDIIREEDAGVLIVGLPRNLEGAHTGQTRSAEAFTEELREHTSLAVEMQDEALTSKQAEKELENRGKPYNRGDIDALAATYILQDWLDEHPEGTA